MRKDTYIRIRLSTEDKEVLKNAAIQSNRNVSEFVLETIRNYIVNEENITNEKNV